LLPSDASSRYREQFRDRLWLHGLYATGVAYLVFLAFYFAMTQIRGMQYAKVQQQVSVLADSYTNAMQLQARYSVLQERENLKFAALDCWKEVADNLPEGITLERFGFGSGGFGSGDTLSLAGTAPLDQEQALYNFSSALERARRSDGSPMFNKNSEPPGVSIYNNQVTWHLTLNLLQKDLLK
ncbi:MAG: hypothetical protein ACREE6_18225, partial [Limisphaerales bacterium]